VASQEQPPEPSREAFGASGRHLSTAISGAGGFTGATARKSRRALRPRGCTSTPAGGRLVRLPRPRQHRPGVVERPHARPQPSPSWPCTLRPRSSAPPGCSHAGRSYASRPSAPQAGRGGGLVMVRACWALGRRPQGQSSAPGQRRVLYTGGCPRQRPADREPRRHPHGPLAPTARRLRSAPRVLWTTSSASQDPRDGRRSPLPCGSPPQPPAHPGARGTEEPRATDHAD